MGATRERRFGRALGTVALIALLALGLSSLRRTALEVEPVETRSPVSPPFSVLRPFPPPPAESLGPEAEAEPVVDCDETKGTLAQMALESYDACAMPAYLAGCLSRPATDAYIENLVPRIRELVQEACGRPPEATDCSEQPCLATLPEGCAPGFEGRGLVARPLGRSDQEAREVVYFSHDDRTALEGFADLVRRRYDRAGRHAGVVGPYQRTEAVCGEQGRAVVRGEGADCAAIALLNGCDPDDVTPSPPSNAADVEDWVDGCTELDGEAWGLDCSVSPCLLTLNGEFERNPCEDSVPEDTRVWRMRSVDLEGGVMTQFYVYPPDWVQPADWMSKHSPAEMFRRHAHEYAVLHGAAPMSDGHLIPAMHY